LFKIASL